MEEKAQIVKLNTLKYAIEPKDLVISVTHGIGAVTEVLYDEDVRNPIGVKFNQTMQTLWLDAKGGGADTESGDARFYSEIKQ